MNTDFFEDYISQGKALMAAQNYAQARKCFEDAIKIDPRSEDAYMNLGNACASLDQFDDAAAAFKNALLVNPKSGEAMFALGNVYLLKRDILKAVEYYNKAEAAGTCRADMYLVMANVFYDAGDQIQALRNINKAIDVRPLDGHLRLFKVRIYLSAHRYSEALETLDDMEKVLPDAFEAYDLRVQIYLGMKNYEAALKICDKALARYPKDAGLALDRLKVLVEWGRDDQAMDMLASMKASGMYEERRKDCCMQEAILALRRKDAQAAVDVLSSANTALGNDKDLLYLIMDIYGKTSQYDKLIKVSEQLLTMDISDFYRATAMYFHAAALEQTSETQKAMGEYRKLTSSLRRMTIQNPGFYEGYVYRLLSHANLGEYEKALTLAEYIENLYPERADAHAFKYFIYKKQGDMEQAAREAEAVHKMDPDFVL